MAKDSTPIVKRSRREGLALHPKAHKYLIRKNGGPGQHSFSRRYGSKRNQQYSAQLREKQKVRRLYGLLERQFANLLRKAIRQNWING